MRHYEAQMQYVRSTKVIDKFKVLDNLELSCVILQFSIYKASTQGTSLNRSNMI